MDAHIEAKYWAFISYSHQDNLEKRIGSDKTHVRWAEWLHEALETWRVPQEFRDRRLPDGEMMPERFFPVFQDEKELPLDADLESSIRHALDESRLLIVICSPRSAKSFYVNEEVRYFKQLGRKDRILALIIDGEPNAGDGNKHGFMRDDECFCPAIRHPLQADGTLLLSSRDFQEPIAGDVRLKTGGAPREIHQKEFGHHREMLDYMKLKLLAGLMHVGFDELAQRDKARQLREAAARTRRLRNLVALFACIALIAIMAGVAAFFSRQEAEKQRKAADEQRQNAEQQKTEADTQRKLAETQTLEAERQKKQALHLLVTGYLQQASAFFNQSADKPSSTQESDAGAESKPPPLTRTPTLAEIEQWRQGLTYLAAAVRADPTDARPENAIVQVLGNWNWPFLEHTYPLDVSDVREMHWTARHPYLALSTRTGGTSEKQIYVDTDTGSQVNASQAGKMLPAKMEQTYALGNGFLGLVSPDGKQMAVVRLISETQHETWEEFKCRLEIYRIKPAAEFEPGKGRHSSGRFTWEEHPATDGGTEISVRLTGDAGNLFQTHLPDDGTTSRCLFVDEKRGYVAIGNSIDYAYDKNANLEVHANVQLWDIKQNRMLWKTMLRPSHINDLTINSELGAIALNGVVTDDKPILYCMALDENTGGDITPSCSDGSKPVYVSLVPDSPLLVLSGKAGVELRDLQNPAFKKGLSAPTDNPGEIFVSPDGRLLAHTDNRNEVGIISLKQEAEERTLHGQSAVREPVWFNPDGSHLLVADNDTMSDQEMYRLIDTASGEYLSDPIGDVVFGGATPDNNWFVFDEAGSGQGNHKVTLRDAETAGKVFQLPLLRVPTADLPFNRITLSFGNLEQEILVPADFLGDDESAIPKTAMHLHFYPPPAPAWLADLAEAASGLAINQQGALKNIEDTSQRLAALRRELQSAPPSPLADWGRSYSSGESNSAITGSIPPPTAAATPATTTAGSPAPSPDDAGLVAFLEGFLNASNSDSKGGEINYYADQVDYYDDGTKDLNFIRSDIKKYNETWPARKFTLNGNPAIENLGHDTHRVTCKIDFNVSNSNESKKSTVTEAIVVQKIAGKLRIIKIQTK